MDTNLHPYIEKAISEILFPEFDVTKQYLEVNEVEFDNGKPKIERVDLMTTWLRFIFPSKTNAISSRLILQKHRK